MNVLSLFDGMSCGQLALQKLGIKVDNYFASEIEESSISVTQDNFPNTRQLGDVSHVKGSAMPEIDLLLGGSPCQGFSYAGKGLNFEDPRSKLFFEYVRLLNECKPRYFLLENVPMLKEHEIIISKYLGVEPIFINSTLVSAQNRERLYWTNINLKQYGLFGEHIADIPQPKDRKITLRHIVEDKPYKKKTIKNPLTLRNTGNYMQYDNSGKGFGSVDQRFYFLNGKTGSLCKSLSSVPKFESGDDSYCFVSDRNMWEQLQTVPVGYTRCVSDNLAFQMLGNGWTVDVIAHILSFAKFNGHD